MTALDWFSLGTCTGLVLAYAAFRLGRRHRPVPPHSHNTDTAAAIVRRYLEQHMTQPATLPAEAVVGRRIAFSYRDDLRHIPRDQVGTITAIADDQPCCLRIRLDGARSGIYVRPDYENLHYLSQVIPVPDLPMGRFAPTRSEAGFDHAFGGVSVVEFEEGDMAAFTPDRAKAEAAVATYLREVHGMEDESEIRDQVAELRLRNVVFEWQPEDADVDWHLDDAEPNTDHAVQVHYLPAV